MRGSGEMGCHRKVTLRVQLSVFSYLSYLNFHHLNLTLTHHEDDDDTDGEDDLGRLACGNDGEDGGQQ